MSALTYAAFVAIANGTSLATIAIWSLAALLSTAALVGIFSTSNRSN